MEENKISLPSSISFDITDRTPGTFDMIFKSNLFMFEFTPNQSEDFCPHTVNLERSPIFFFLHKLTSLSHSTSQENEQILKFFHNQKRSFVRFFFSPESLSQIDRMIEWMVENSAIALKTAGTYVVIAEVKKSYVHPHGKLDLTRLQCLYSFRQELDKLGYSRTVTQSSLLTKADILTFFNDNGKARDIKGLYASIHCHGLTHEARIFIYPYLLKLYDLNLSYNENKQREKERIEQYTKFLNVWTSRVPQQYVRSNHFFGVIRQDVIRTDRTREMFTVEESGAVSFLEDVLVCCVIGNHDINYTQGMNDLAAELMQLFFSHIDDSKVATTFAGEKWDQITAESFIFWCLQGFLEITGQGLFFAKMAAVKDFFLHRCFAIIKHCMPTVGKWLADNHLDNLVFSIRPICVLFRRDFTDFLYAWDILLTSDNPPIYIRFFVAAVIVLAFPEMSSISSDDFGAIVTSFDTGLAQRDVGLLIELTNLLKEKTDSDITNMNWVFMKFPDDHTLTDFLPTTFELC